MQVIIMAAGMGTRLGHKTQNCTKGMVHLNGQEMIRYVLDFVDHPYIDETIVVTGFESESLMELLRNNYPNVKTIYNPDYEQGNITTLATAMPYINDNFLLMNADHIYPKRMLAHILKDLDGITAICDFNRTLGADDMKVKFGEDGTLLRIDKQLKDYDCGYIGMTTCTNDHLSMYREAFEATLQGIGKRACVENILGWLGENSADINICDASGMSWLEVDTPEDLSYAENTLRENTDFLL